MCGIYGMVALRGEALRAPELLDAVGRSLRHRGPDGRGVVRRPGFVLGCERLRIIDLHERADQPFGDPDGRAWVACNGEIYNAAELRRRYADYPYRSHSDVETILPLYLDKGVEGLADLDGMFGLAIWDEPARTLVLARDRAGEKPLFISRLGGELWFASEVQAPLGHFFTTATDSRQTVIDWRRTTAEQALYYLDQGQNVCFPTLGDPAIYSTGYYLYETICGIREDIDVEFVPGVPAMSSCSAALASPICLGDEMVAVIPATFSDDRLREVLERFDTIILMKVHRVMDRLVELLKSTELMDRAVLVEKAGTSGERTCAELDKITEPPHYYSTIIVRKNPSTVRTLIN